MVQHQVEDDPDPAIMRLGQEPAEIGQRAVLGRDIAVVADVVAAIPVGRGEVRRQPDRVDAEINKIVELAGDPSEVTDAIAVTVGERARVDLVEDSSLPPFQVGHGALLKCDGLFPTVVSISR